MDSLQLILILSALFVLTFCIGMYVTPYISGLSQELHLYDLPDSRKVHTKPIPRTGGMTFLPAVTISIALLLVIQLRYDDTATTLWRGTAVIHFLGYLSGSMLLFAIGLYDDIHGVGYRVKFVVQVIAASLLCLSGLWVSNFNNVFFINAIPFWIGMPVTVASVVYLTNAMNLIDGIDGLASGLSSIALVVIAILNVLSGNVVWAMMAVAYLGVLVAFFYYNVFNRKYKVFMGDAGSLTLGFTLSFLIVQFWHGTSYGITVVSNVPILAVSPLVIPLFDVVRVMMSRIRDGRNPFLPDKNHIHHKLLRAGLSGKMTMVTLLLLSCLFIIGNYVVADVSQTLIVLIDVVGFAVMHLVINFFIRRKETKAGITWTRELKEV